jgi:nitrite reductase (NO-forming)/hydroxylamine reductase
LSLLSAAHAVASSHPAVAAGKSIATTPADAGEILFRQNCSGCHTYRRGDHLGPDLVTRGSPQFVRNFIADPARMVVESLRGQQLYATWGYVMPNFGLTSTQIDDLVAFLGRQDGLGPLQPLPAPTLTPAEFDLARDVYFNRCAGCHGLYRTGATGPNIGAERAQWIGTDGLAALLRHGTPRGMPNFGTSGVLTEDDIHRLSGFLQLPPPDPPALPMAEIEASWNLVVAVADRPTAPAHALNWMNFFGVIERDAGKISIYDGDTRERVVRLDVGFAVHILRSSGSGRYFYAIGRDGLVSLIDLWSATPMIVASVKGCHDARSVEGSKFEGFEDRYLVQGCYWPPQYVVYDGLTLEPLARNDLPMEDINGATLPEVRVAAIVSSPFEPLWVLALKESGMVALVDYNQPGFPLVASIATERFLHDGGWDPSGRYFLVAANASNKMVVVDVAERSFVTSFTTGNTPHPGRGTNWIDPEFGWVNATPHIGEGKLSIYGVDPVDHPDHAWQVVREIALPAAGSLFVKTHANSPWVFIDMTLSATHGRQVCVYAKGSGVLDHCFDVASTGKAVHFEFNQDGSQVWIADWASDGAIVVLDSQTLEQVDRLEGLQTPTGKFNVYNTAFDGHSAPADGVFADGFEVD